MAAPQWEVRNAATLCYTALLVRILGFRNTASSVSIKQHTCFTHKLSEGAQ